MLIKYFKDLFTDKELMRKCLTISLPIMLQSLIMSAVNIVDNLMVGQLGDVAISGVASANKFYDVLSFVCFSTIAACIIFLSQYNGARNEEKMKETYRFTFVVVSIIVLIVFTIIKLFPSQLIKFIIDDESIIDAGTRYFKYAVYSYIPMIISYPVSSSMRAVGDSKRPMIISILSVLINAFLDYGLILGHFGLPRLEIEGAAIATIIARAIEAILYIITVKINHYEFDTRIIDIFKFDKALVKQIVIKALPLVLNEIAWNVGMVTLMKCYSARGATVNAAYAVSATVSDLFFALFSGMATASTVLIGTPLGANKLDEAKDNGYKLICFSLFLSIFFGLGLFLSSFRIEYIYTNLSKEVIDSAKIFLRWMGVLYWIYMFNTQCYFTLRAGGDTKSTMILDCIYMWSVNIPLVAALTYFTDLNIFIVYVAGQLTDIGKGILAYKIVKKNNWVKNLTVI